MATRLLQRQRNSPYMGNATSIYKLARTSITNRTARTPIPLSDRFRTQFSPLVMQLPQKMSQLQALGCVFQNSCAHLDELFILPRMTILTRFSGTAPRHQPLPPTIAYLQRLTDDSSLSSPPCRSAERRSPAPRR